MSIIEDVLKRAGVEEVKVEDLRPGDRFVTTVDQYATSGIFIFSTGQRWYLVERAPVEEPTGWGAIVEVDGVKYSRIPDEGVPDTAPWVRGAGYWYAWEELIEEGAPKILFEGISE